MIVYFHSSLSWGKRKVVYLESMERPLWVQKSYVKTLFFMSTFTFILSALVSVWFFCNFNNFHSAFNRLLVVSKKSWQLYANKMKRNMLARRNYLLLLLSFFSFLFFCSLKKVYGRHSYSRCYVYISENAVVIVV